MPTFLAPWFLIAGAAAAVPVALHLLHRRRPQPVPFSTIRFLAEAIAKTRRSRHLTNFLVLLMRVLILLLLAFSFAQPQIRSVSFLPEGRRNVLIVLDASAGMHYREGEQSCFERARDRALKLIGSLAEGDRVAVWLPGRPEPRLVFPPISDHQAVHRAVQDSLPGYGDAPLATTLAHLLDRLNETGADGDEEVHVFSDFQTAGWDETGMATVAQRLEQRRAVLFLNTVRPAVVANAGLVKVRLHPPAVLGDGIVEARCELRASESFQDTTAARLLLDGAEKNRRTVRVTPGRDTTLSLTGRVEGDAPGVTGRIELDPDGFDLDNTFRFSLPRLPGIPVLLVDGSAQGAEGARDTFYLKHAIQPGQRAATLFLPEVVDWTTFLSGDLSRFSIVYLCNPPTMDEAAADKLEPFVRNGGTVVLMPGQHHVLEAGLRRLTVLRDTRVAKDILPQERAVGLVPADPPAELQKRLLSLIPPPEAVVVRRRLLLQGLPETARAAFHFHDGAPFAVELPFGHGNVWITAVGANRDWSEWPLTPFFVVFQQELIKRSARRTLSERTGSVGTPMALDWPGDALSVDVRLQDPGGRERVLNLERTDADKPFLIHAFDTPGLYRVRHRDSEQTLAINIPADETDLRYRSNEELGASLRACTWFAADSWHELQNHLVGVRQGRPLWPLLLAVAFFLCISEEFFANLRSRATVVPETLRQFLSRGGRRP